MTPTIDEPLMPVNFAVEICTDETGNVLWVERYFFNRIHKPGDGFIKDWKEYKVIGASFTVGKHGSALVEHVVKVIEDRSPAPPADVAAAVTECERELLRRGLWHDAITEAFAALRAKLGVGS